MSIEPERPLPLKGSFPLLKSILSAIDALKLSAAVSYTHLRAHETS